MSDAFSALSTTELRALADALEDGRLVDPPSTAAVSRFVARECADAVRDELTRLLQLGCSTRALAAFVAGLAHDRSRRPEPDDLIDLVWSGPEVPGIRNRDTAIVVRELFQDAREVVHLAGYAVDRRPEIFRVLAQRYQDEPELQVRMFMNIERTYKDRTTRSEEFVRRFAHEFSTVVWPQERKPEVFYFPDALEADWKARAVMHAKCVVVDRRTAFVSSANFTKRAQDRNIEAGTLIRSGRYATRLADHFDALAAAGVLERLRLA